MEKSHPSGWVLRYSESGIPFYEVPTPMPPIPRRVLSCAVYIYRSPENANAGEGGATGFFVGVRSSYEGMYFMHPYVVTNEHVLHRCGESPVLRINRKDGGTDILRTALHDWRFHPDGDDLAVYPIALDAAHEFSYVDIGESVEEDKLPFWVGVGSETFMVGRFMSHDGKQRNSPVVRYGNIAMMPGEPIDLETCVKQKCFLVEMRSIPGTSGSPVFALYSPVQYVEHGPFGPPRHQPPQNWALLLGVDFCHLNTHEKVRDKKTGEAVSEGYFVNSNAGMAGVVPAWRLRELLNSEELVNRRKESDMKTKLENAAKKKVAFDSGDDETGKPFTRSDFEDALKRVSRKIEHQK